MERKRAQRTQEALAGYVKEEDLSGTNQYKWALMTTASAATNAMFISMICSNSSLTATQVRELREAGGREAVHRARVPSAGPHLPPHALRLRRTGTVCLSFFIFVFIEHHTIPKNRLSLYERRAVIRRNLPTPLPSRLPLTWLPSFRPPPQRR